MLKNATPCFNCKYGENKTEMLDKCPLNEFRYIDGKVICLNYISKNEKESNAIL